MSTRRGTGAFLGLVSLTAVVLSACGGGSDDSAGKEAVIADGVVSAVDGNLTGVSSFTIRLPDGTHLTFVPAEGVLFDDAAPISHLRQHIASGVPVRVAYLVLGDGTLSAVMVEDV